MRQHLMYLVIATSCVAAALSGCGGDSEDSNGDGKAGSAGVAPGGSGNSAGSAGRPGGSSGNPGGGGGGAGGAASGGNAGAATGGFGSVLNNPPDPVLRDRCLAQCDRQNELDCPNQSAGDCERICDLAPRFENCESELDAALDCSESATYVCGDNGAEAPGCALQVAALTLCMTEELQDPALAEPCSKFCTAQARPACENEDSVQDCTVGCPVLTSVLPACRDPYSQYLTCAGNQTFTCDAEGQAQPAGCDAEGLAFFGCLLLQGGGLPPLP